MNTQIGGAHRRARSPDSGMNETSGTNVPDTSGNNIAGTAVNGPTWVPGRPSRARARLPLRRSLVGAGRRCVRTVA